jgi:hypothetical protein
MIALIVLAGYSCLITLLWCLFPRTTIVVHHEPANVKQTTKAVTAQIMRDVRGARHYDCGCRISGAVGVPGCGDCTEPGLR